MTWQDFEEASALERDVIVRCLPLVPTAGDGSSVAVIDLKANTAELAVYISETLGATPDRCVELLRIRPLLVGAAWKVIDLLIEERLSELAKTPDTKRGWSIKKKVELARNRISPPTAIEPNAWEAQTKTYVELAELRHSLVHRRAHLDKTDALVGVDENKKPLRPLTADEQNALGRAALRAAQLVTVATPDLRVAADLTRQLGYLHGIHGVNLPTIVVADSLPEITAIIDPEASESGDPAIYRFDIPALKKRHPFKTSTQADLTVRFRDRPGEDLRGRLEDAPDEIVHLDPNNPPDWLS
jgi:hypothetical protein